MADQPPAASPAAELPPLPTRTCPHCSNPTPVGNYCGVCGAHLQHPEAKLAARRAHSFSANPEEAVMRLSVVSTLFPHLSHRSSVPFRAGFALLVGLLILFSATGLEAPVIALAAMGVPLLFQLYIYEVDIYEENHLLLAAVTLLIGAGLGVGWALLGGPVVSHALQPTIGASLSGGDVVNAAVTVPIISQALMLVPLLLVLVLVPGFGSRKESLDGFTLGAASALGFSFAAVITDLTSRLSAGLVPNRPFTSILTEALIRGVATPVLVAAATGLVGASIWARKAEQGTVAAGGRWLTNPLLVLAAMLAVEVGLGFADQARMADIPLLFVHLAGTAVVLLALRVGLHHILLHEQHDVTIGPSVTCSHCNHIVPFMPFCPACGVAQVATTKRHRPRPGPEGEPAVAGAGAVGGAAGAAGPAAAGGWPTLSPGAVPAAAWSGFPLAGTPVARVHRAHHTFLIGLFTAGLVAITVALVLTAVTQQPNTTPVPRCHVGGCPGLALAGSYQAVLVSGQGSDANAGRPEPPPYGTWQSGDGRFSIGLFIPGMFGRPQVKQSATGISFTFNSATFDGLKLGGGTIVVADVSPSAEASSAQQVVQNVVSQNMPSASLAYSLPDAIVGSVPGYGGVYDDDVNSASGTQIDYRVMVMAAIRNGVAVVVMAVGPDDPSFQSSPLLFHPSFVDLDIALGGGLDGIVNSIQWTSTSLNP